MLRIGLYSIDVVQVYTYCMYRKHIIVEDGLTLLLNTFWGGIVHFFALPYFYCSSQSPPRMLGKDSYP